MSELIVSISVVAASLLGSLAALPVMNGLSGSRDQRSFRQALKDGVIKEKITYGDLQHIAECWNQNRKSILYNLRMLLSEAIREEGELASSVDYIRELLASHQKNEPFAELPENISIQLNDIQGSLVQNALDDVNRNKIDQLAASLSTLYVSNQHSISKEKNMTRAGFFIGLLGITWSVISFFVK